MRSSIYHAPVVPQYLIKKAVPFKEQGLKGTGTKSLASKQKVIYLCGDVECLVVGHQSQSPGEHVDEQTNKRLLQFAYFRVNKTLYHLTLLHMPFHDEYLLLVLCM